LIDKIEVFDISGRLIYQKSAVNQNQQTIDNIIAAEQVLLVKVTSQDKATVTQKIIY